MQLGEAILPIFYFTGNLVSVKQTRSARMRQDAFLYTGANKKYFLYYFTKIMVEKPLTIWYT